MTRTGNAKLDSLLDLFETGHIDVEGGGLGGAPWQPTAAGLPYDDPVSDYAKEWLAAGMCDNLASSLAGFLRARGIEARDTHGHTLAALGYEDYPEMAYSGSTEEFPYDRHALCLVRHEDAIYTIDYAACQYLYVEFPLVQRRRPGGGWQRHW